MPQNFHLKRKLRGSSLSPNHFPSFLIPLSFLPPSPSRSLSLSLSLSLLPPFSFFLSNELTMKLTFGSLFNNNNNSNNRSSSSMKKKKKEPRSISKLEEVNPPSFGSGSGSVTSSSSSSDFSSPRTVLPLSFSDLFNIFDRNRDGKITKEELESVLRQLGPDPVTEDELISMVEVVDRDGDGCISLEELSAIEDEVAVVMTSGGGDEEELKDVFRVFDADGDGKISAAELYQVMAALGEGECTMEECRRMISGVDSDGDGFVCFRDFVRMMEGQAEKR